MKPPVTLSPPELKARLGRLPGWELEGSSIRRQFTFGGFADAIAFTVRLAFDAEAADHHPDLVISYRRVTVTWTTHSAGGLTEKDLTGAAAADEAAAAFRGR